MKKVVLKLTNSVSVIGIYTMQIINTALNACVRMNTYDVDDHNVVCMLFVLFFALYIFLFIHTGVIMTLRKFV